MSAAGPTRFHQRLGFRIGVAILLMETLVLGAVGGYYVSHYWRQVDARVAAEIQLPGTLMQQGALRYASVQDLPSLQRLVGQVVLDALVLEPNGTIFESRHPDWRGRQAEAMLPGFEFKFPRPSETLLVQGSSHGASSMASLTPLVSGGNHIGWLYLRVNTLRANTEKHSLAMRYGAATCCSILLTWTSIILLMNRITGARIRATVEALSRARAGDLSVRIRSREPDEIGQVQRDIDEVLGEIEQRTATRDRALADMAASEEKYREIFNSTSDALFIHDADARILDVNRSMCEMYGCDRDQALALSLSDLCVPGEEAYTLVNAQRLVRLALEEGPQAFEWYCRRLDGRLFWADIALHGFTISGEPRVIAAVRDISERKQAEQALRESEDRLHQSEKMTAVGQLAGGIAHDFNNQLGGILGYAELLERKLPDPALRRYAEGIRTAALLAADLTQQMLAFARKGRHLSVPVDLHAIIRETAAILERTIDKRVAIRLRLEAAASVVTGDPAQLQNTVLNLGVNARDAMPQGGELVFATAVEALADALPAENLAAGRYLVLSVTDSGIGMDAATQKRIFEPFFTTKEPGKGTGLGLASVYGTVNNHGGVIRVTSEPGRGSTFRIHLPLSPDRAEPAPAAAPALVYGHGRILLIDDETVICDMADKLLTDLGYTVTVCGNPIEALALYRKEWQAIDLVILDMVMPKLSGKDLFLALREINPRIRAILSSGYAMDGGAQSILDAGVLGFVQKPFRQATLARAVAEALGKGGEAGA